MTHFLWVEDFNASEDKRPDNIISSTVKSVFGSVLGESELRIQLGEDEYDAQDFLEEKGILLKLNLLEALEFIRNPDELAKIDFVVLDVDMPLRRDGQKDNNNYLPSLIEQYESADDLRKIAGYQIYTELVIELGFPKSHILFCSNHASYFDKLKGKFASANIKPPLSSNPDKPFLTKDDKTDIKQWLDEAQCDYFVLRRGIIEGCQYLKKLNQPPTAFNQFQESGKETNLDEIHDYLQILENFLPLRKPYDKATCYKLFLRTLTHEWESAKPEKIKGLAWIMKSTRNWITHNSNLFNALDEKMLAYLFIINIRLMFGIDEAVQSYEKILLNLFADDAVSEIDFKTKTANKLIPFSKAYLELKNLVLDERRDNSQKIKLQDGFYFNELANNIQQSNSSFRNDKPLFIKLLYQMFWLTTSNPYVDTGYKRNLLEIKFWDFKYPEKPYLLELARHIYNRSFP